jgi:6-phosphogluconolactonase
MTFTFPALALARHVVFTVEGEGKLDAWRKVRSGADLPAGRVTAQRVTWLVSRDLAV